MRVNYQQVVNARSQVQAVSEEIAVMQSVKAPKSYIDELNARLATFRRESIKLASIWISQNPTHA